MDVLTRAKNLYEELKVSVDALEFVQKKLKKQNLDQNEFEQLYKEEFRLSMNIAGSYTDLTEILKKLDKSKENEFFTKRMRQNIDKLVKVHSYDIG